MFSSWNEGAKKRELIAPLRFNQCRLQAVTICKPLIDGAFEVVLFAHQVVCHAKFAARKFHVSDFDIINNGVVKCFGWREERKK